MYEKESINNLVVDFCFIDFDKNYMIERFSWLDGQNRFYFLRKEFNLELLDWKNLRIKICSGKHSVFLDKECTIPLIFHKYKCEYLNLGNETI